MALFERKLEYVKVSLTELLEIISFNGIVVAMLFMKKDIDALIVGNVLRGLSPSLFIIFTKKIIN